MSHSIGWRSARHLGRRVPGHGVTSCPTLTVFIRRSPLKGRFFSSGFSSNIRKSARTPTSRNFILISSQKQASTMSSATSFFDFKALDATEAEVPLSNYKGKVVLVVNTASKCGFTYQYENLESVYKALNKEYLDDFVVIAFPCNQFGGQEPGSNEAIQEFACGLKSGYKVTFPVMAKIDVNGDKAHPLYQWLKKEKPGLLGIERIKWNFEKFLIGRDGKVVDRWASTTVPEKFQARIIEELKKKAPVDSEPSAGVAETGKTETKAVEKSEEETTTKDKGEEETTTKG